MACVAVQVLTGKEKQVGSDIQKKTGYKVYIPSLLEITVTKDSMKTTKTGSQLRGYVLIELPNSELSPEAWHIVKSVRGVLKILSGNITEDEMNNLRKNSWPVIQVIERISFNKVRKNVIKLTFNLTKKGKEKLINIVQKLYSTVGNTSLFEKKLYSMLC